MSQEEGVVPACHPSNFGGEYKTRLFFSDRVEDIERAQAICRNCEMREDCLALGLATDARTSVWGGMYITSRGRVVNKPPRSGRPAKKRA